MAGAGQAAPLPLACDVGKLCVRCAQISLAELETDLFRYAPSSDRARTSEVPRRGRLEVRVDEKKASEI